MIIGFLALLALSKRDLFLVGMSYLIFKAFERVISISIINTISNMLDCLVGKFNFQKLAKNMRSFKSLWERKGGRAPKE